MLLSENLRVILICFGSIQDYVAGAEPCLTNIFFHFSSWMNLFEIFKDLHKQENVVNKIPGVQKKYADLLGSSDVNLASINGESLSNTPQYCKSSLKPPPGAYLILDTPEGWLREGGLFITQLNDKDIYDSVISIFYPIFYGFNIQFNESDIFI